MHHIYDIDHYILIVFKNIFLLALSIVGAEWGWKQKCLTITLPQDSPVTIQRAVGARLQGNLIKWTSVTLLTVSRSRFGGGFAYRRQLCFVTKCHNTMCDYQIQQESPWNFCKQVKCDISILEKLKRLDPDTSNVVKWDGFFLWHWAMYILKLWTPGIKPVWPIPLEFYENHTCCLQTW